MLLVPARYRKRITMSIKERVSPQSIWSTGNRSEKNCWEWGAYASWRERGVFRWLFCNCEHYETNKATYHNGCRALFRSGMLQRLLKKREMDSANVGAAVSPKKTRVSYKATLDREKPSVSTVRSTMGKVMNKYIASVVVTAAKICSNERCNLRIG